MQIIKEAEQNRVAIGHFNISNFEALKAIFEAARGLNLPVIIGTSEGERDFIGVRQVVALIKSLREEFDYPIFLNADHSHSLEKVKEALEAGYDMIHFDGSQLSYEENIKKTKEVVDYVRQSTVPPQRGEARPILLGGNSQHSTVLVEGELGYLRGTSEVRKEAIEIKQEDLTKLEQAKEFAERTGVDLLAIAVGNIHGMMENSPNPKFDINRIKAIKEAVNVPLVLHGGSGTPAEEVVSAIEAGISIIHINTELRLAWRQGIERVLKENPEEIIPYKILPPVIGAMRKIIETRLKLFNKLV